MQEFNLMNGDSFGEFLTFENDIIKNDRSTILHPVRH